MAASAASKSSTRASSLEQLLAAKEIVICCGAGGVGKTTTAAAAAVMASVSLGGNVLVITVDPARRLADALGMEGIGNVETEVPPEAFKVAGVENRGRLWVAMLDTKDSWDQLVRTHAPNGDIARRIFDNRLYENISTRFVQSHDYIALERLYAAHGTGRYDLIVVDTPPTRNTASLLSAPEHLDEFFSSRLLRWLTGPSRSRVVNLASRPFYQVADRILGSQFLEDVAEFFLLFQTMHKGFVERAQGVIRLLHDRRTSFLAVSTLESAPLRETELFIQALLDGGFHTGGLVLNKLLPDYFLDPDLAHVAQRLTGDSAAVAAAVAAEDSNPEAVARVLREVGESFVNFGVVAKREAELRAELSAVPDVVVGVPIFDTDIYDMAGLLRLGNVLWRQ